MLQQIVELEERDGVGQCKINALDNACQVGGRAIRGLKDRVCCSVRVVDVSLCL